MYCGSFFTYVEVRWLKKSDISAFTTPNKEHERWTCYCWNQNEYLLNSWSKSHTYMTYNVLFQVHNITKPGYVPIHRTHYRSQFVIGVYSPYTTIVSVFLQASLVTLTRRFSSLTSTICVIWPLSFFHKNFL